MENEISLNRKQMIKRSVLIKAIEFSSLLLLLTLIPDKFRLPQQAVLGKQSTPYKLQRQKVDFPEPNFYLANPTQVLLAKKKLSELDPKYLANYTRLMTDADKILKEPAPTVVSKNDLPPSNNPHDYLSRPTYAWPDPSKPNGIPNILKDGQINPDYYNQSDNRNLTKLVSNLNTLSFAFYFSHNSKYADKSIEILRTWFINPETKMNPNLTFAQTPAGGIIGNSSGLIDGYRLPAVLDSISILDQSAKLSPDDKQKLTQWFASYYDWLSNSKEGERGKTLKNNIGNWYDFQRVAIAYYLGKMEDVHQILNQVKQDKIAEQIETDGSQPQELKRATPITYSAFNLQSFCSLAVIGNKTDINLINYQSSDGRSIPKALQYLKVANQNDSTVDQYFKRSSNNVTDQCAIFSASALLINKSLFNLLYPEQ